MRKPAGQGTSSGCLGGCAPPCTTGGTISPLASTYERLLAFCRERRLKLLSDSYEFCVNDYITTGDESEYITQILFFVEREAAV